MPDSRLLGVALFLGLLALSSCGASPASSDDDSVSEFDNKTSRAASLSMTCSGCHSEQSSAVVSLKGYDADAIRESLMRYKSESDGTTVMHRLARGYSDQDIEVIAMYLGDKRVDE